MKKYSGFTLVELMMTITVIAIVAAVALPSFEDITKRNRATAIANTVLSTLAYARSEAATRNASVQVSPIAGGNWANGWQIIVDGNNDGDFVDGAGVDDVLKIYEGISNHSTLTQDLDPAGLGAIQFQPSGELGPAAAAPLNEQFTYRALTNCNPGRNYKRIILVSPSGIARISTDIAC